MNRYETVIVGAGIAGASAALQLSQHQHVLLIEAQKPAAGASGVAGGLFSPMIALRGRPVWQIDEAIAAFKVQLGMAGISDLFDDRGVLRPAKDEQQVGFFKQSVEMCPQHAEWWSADETKERYPLIHAPLGALFAKSGGAISTTVFSQKMVAAAKRQGADYIEGKRVSQWQIENDGVQLILSTASNAEAVIKANRVIFALGAAFFDMTHFQHLDLHAVKGQTIRINRPASLTTADIPPSSGLAYIIPEADSLAIGSSFEHTFSNKEASRHLSEQLLQKAAALIPEIAGEEIQEEHVGIRVTVPVIRLPMVGPIDATNRLWVFTGFGSKGLLLAPLLASRLHKYFQQPFEIPSEIGVRVKT